MRNGKKTTLIHRAHQTQVILWDEGDKDTVRYEGGVHKQQYTHACCFCPMKGSLRLNTAGTYSIGRGCLESVHWTKQSHNQYEG